MLNKIAHIGITVKDMEKSLDFYQNVLGLKLQAKAEMKGEETDRLFAKKNCHVKLSYLETTDKLSSPPIELIQFVSEEVELVPSSLSRTSISELCFATDDIDSFYQRLVEAGVECLSEPEIFDFTSDWFW